jgi:hypothetical protein
MATKPLLTPRMLKDRPGWYVLLVWPNGREQHITNFDTEAEAQAWIDNNSAAWLSKANSRTHD